MLSYRLGTVNDFHWGFKPVLSYSKPHTFSSFFGEEKERKNAFNISKTILTRYKQSATGCGYERKTVFVTQRKKHIH